MPEPVDESLRVFREIKGQLASDLAAAHTEADARFRVIDRLIVEVLGWPRADVSVEVASDKGRIDYLNSIRGVPRLVVEAKSQDAFAFGDLHRSGQAYKISGAVFSERSVSDAIVQGAQYAKGMSIALCAVSNGSDWIVYLGNRIDGMRFEDGYAFLFHGLAGVEANFALFFSLLHRSAVERFAYRDLFDGAEKGVAKHFDVSLAVRKPNAIQRHARSERVTDIERICQHFFRDIVNPNDPDMLAACFIETRESKQADAKLLRITQHLTSQVQSLGAGNAPLIRAIEDTLNTKHEEVVLLVGGKGVGKSTFLQRFFSKALPDDLKKVCVAHRLDLARAPRDPQGIHGWLHSALLQEVDTCQTALGADSPDHIQGVFFGDYQRWSKISHAHLYESNKAAFKIEFESYVEEIRKTRPDDYCAAFLGDISRNRKKLPILVFDNVDHHSLEIQEVVFQYALTFSRRKEIPALLIILPVTVRTLWQLARETTFESTFTSRFYLPPPPVADVLRKRLAFIHDKIESGQKIKSAEYFLSQSIRVTLDGLAQFVAHVQSALINNQIASRTLEMLSNGDIRRLMELTYGLIASPYLKTADLFTSYVTQEPLAITRLDFMKALIRRDCLSFKRDENSFVVNLFEIVPGLYSSPLLGMRLLSYLKVRYMNAEGVGKPQSRDCGIAEFTDFFLQMGVAQREVAEVLTALLERGLVESQDPTKLSYDTAEAVAVTPAGLQHLEWAFTNEVYLEAMAEVSTLHSSADHSALKAHYEEKPLPSFSKIRSVFARYCIGLDARLYAIPQLEAYADQRRLAESFGTIWKTDAGGKAGG